MASVLSGGLPVERVDPAQIIRPHRPQNPAGWGSRGVGQRLGFENLVVLVHPETHLVVERLAERGCDEGLGPAAGGVDQGAGGLGQRPPVAPAAHRYVHEDRADPSDRAVDRGHAGRDDGATAHTDQQPHSRAGELPFEVLAPLAPAAGLVDRDRCLDVGRHHWADLQIGHTVPPRPGGEGGTVPLCAACRKPGARGQRSRRPHRTAQEGPRPV